VKASTDATHILHFAWIIRVPNSTNQVMLCTVYDGDFDAYLGAFIDSNLAGFNFVLSQLKDAPPPHLEKREARPSMSGRPGTIWPSRDRGRTLASAVSSPPIRT